MKHLIFAGLIISLSAGNVEMLHPFGANEPSFKKVIITDTATIAGKWKLVPVLTSDTSAGKVPEITFDLKTNTFSGNTGCNAMSGTFIVKQDGLIFNADITTTKMTCPGYNEKAFFDNLLRTNRYQIKDGVLQLMYNTTILSKWSRHLDTTVTKQI